MKNKGSRKRIFLFVPTVIVCLMLTACSGREGVENAYDLYDTSASYISYGDTIRLAGETVDLFASDLCVGGVENSTEPFEYADNATAEAVFVLNDGEITYAKNIYEQRYPASTTKILTAYLALKYGNLDETVTVSETALSSLPWDASVCGLKEGDQITLRDALYGMLLVSGNDAANVIAEAVSGSQEAFAELMNEEAAALGATQSHFTNASGLTDEDHYTTVYDLYLIFSAALQYDEFVEIISSDEYSVTWTNAEGETSEQVWQNSNAYLTGEYEMPDGVHVIGGKTGTTDAAGHCLVLYCENASDSPIISIVLGSQNHADLYHCMSGLLVNFATAQ